MRTNTKEDCFKEKKTETIILSDLEKIEIVTNGPNYLDIDEIDDFEYEYIDNKKEENKELIAELDKLKTRTFELYYKIDNQLTKELESNFKQSKLKINFIQIPKILKDGVLWTASEKSFIMYDCKFFRKISELKFEKECDIASAIELDNKDLVLLAFVKEGDSWCKILIYRLKNDKYELIQNINENQKGYSSQFVQYGFCGRSISKKPYNVEYIKKISGNRFICVNSYGFKIYASNEKQEYSIISLNEYLEGIKIIYEINPNKFIFGTEKRSSNDYIRYNNNILFQVVDLKEITKDEINKKLNELNEDDRDYLFFCFSKSNKESKVSEESKNILESLKVSCSFKTIFHYNRGEYSYIKDYIILKSKYMIILLDSSLFILNLDTKEILKKFDIKIAANDKYFIHVHICMKKWYNDVDNNFILFIYGNFYLFELFEEGKEIGLKILNHSYFHNFENRGDIEKLKEKENKFFIQDYSTNSIILY